MFNDVVALTFAFQCQSLIKLVLRNWMSVDPSREFRCFVRRGKLIGICQRDESNFYPGIVELRDKLQEVGSEEWFRLASASGL